MTTAREQLESLLRETPVAAGVRQTQAFDEVAHGRPRIVIFGAGRLGRTVLRGLSDIGLEVVAFSDNDSASWGKTIEGLPLVSPEDAARKYAHDSVFVVAIWHPCHTPLMSALLAQLRSLNCSAVPFPVLFWRYAETFLPYFFWDSPKNLLGQRDDISATFDILADEASRDVYLSQLRLRLLADFDSIGAPLAGDQYFPGLFSLSTDECFVDCGSYTGDTIHSFISQTGNAFRKVIAFEADSAVVPTLQNFVDDLGPRVVVRRSAVGGHNGVVRFAGNGIGGGRISDDSGVEVPCVRLDDSIGRERVSFIKMDIEGAELQALEGAHRIIWRDRPVLAVCGYHKPDHLWRVLASLHTLAPDSKLYLRSHCADGLDTVCYAVPPERQVLTSITHLEYSPSKPRTLSQGAIS